MILHTREFDINRNTVLMGHDRETGKRYLVQEISTGDDINDLIAWDKMGANAWETLKSIFWV